MARILSELQPIIEELSKTRGITEITIAYKISEFTAPELSIKEGVQYLYQKPRLKLVYCDHCDCYAYDLPSVVLQVLQGELPETGTLHCMGRPRLTNTCKDKRCPRRLDYEVIFQTL